MPDIYTQHENAFSNVQAFVIGNPTDRLATIAFKFPKDGAGRLYCYLHVIGFPMVRSYAGGYGYDKRSAAIHAASKLVKLDGEQSMARKELAQNLLSCIKDDGFDWDKHLRDAGFHVWRAV